MNLFKEFTNIQCLIRQYNKKDDNRDWPCRKLIIGPSGSGKTNYLLNSIQKDNNIIDRFICMPKI